MKTAFQFKSKYSLLQSEIRKDYHYLLRSCLVSLITKLLESKTHLVLLLFLIKVQNNITTYLTSKNFLLKFHFYLSRF